MDKAPNWASGYFNYTLGSGAGLEDSPLRRVLDWVAPEDGVSERSAIEIGCFPGRFIDHIGGRGWRVSGIDTYSRVLELGEWISSR